MQKKRKKMATNCMSLSEPKKLQPNDKRAHKKTELLVSHIESQLRLGISYAIVVEEAAIVCCSVRIKR